MPETKRINKLYEILILNQKEQEKLLDKTVDWIKSQDRAGLDVGTNEISGYIGDEMPGLTRDETLALASMAITKYRTKNNQSMKEKLRKLTEGMDEIKTEIIDILDRYKNMDKLEVVAEVSRDLTGRYTDKEITATLDEMLENGEIEFDTQHNVIKSESFKEANGKYDFSQPNLKYGSKEWDELSKAYKADPHPKFFKPANGGTIERRGSDVYIDGKKAFYQKLRNGAEYIVDKNGRTLADYDGYKRNGFEKKFGKPKKHPRSESFKEATKKDYRIFDTKTMKGMKDAERHQQALYKKYKIVKVEPAGFSKVAVWGESLKEATPKVGDYYFDTEGNRFVVDKVGGGFVWLRNPRGVKQIGIGELKYYKTESFKEATKSQQFKIINDNNVKLQNWRNDRITYYSNRGYSPVEVSKYIDNTLLPSVKRYSPEYTDKVLDTTIPKVDSGLLNSLNTKLSVKFPPKTKESLKEEFSVKDLIASKGELDAISRGVAPEVYVYAFKTSNIPQKHKDEAKALLKKESFKEANKPLDKHQLYTFAVNTIGNSPSPNSAKMVAEIKKLIDQGKITTMDEILDYGDTHGESCKTEAVSKKQRIKIGVYGLERQYGNQKVRDAAQKMFKKKTDDLSMDELDKLADELHSKSGRNLKNRIEKLQEAYKEAKSQEWKVYLNGKNIDTVFYQLGIDAEEVRKGLIDHDGYDSGITVKKGKVIGKEDVDIGDEATVNGKEADVVDVVEGDDEVALVQMKAEAVKEGSIVQFLNDQWTVINFEDDKLTLVNGKGRTVYADPKGVKVIMESLKKLPGTKPTIKTAAGEGKYIGTEVEDEKGKWNDNYAINDGFWVIHQGDKHHVYEVKKESFKEYSDEIRWGYAVKTGLARNLAFTHINQFIDYMKKNPSVAKSMDDAIDKAMKSQKNSVRLEKLKESYKETYSPEQLASKAQSVYISTTVGGNALDKYMRDELDLKDHTDYEYVINQKLKGKEVGVLFLLTSKADARWAQTRKLGGFSRTSVADLKKQSYELWESLKEKSFAVRYTDRRWKPGGKDSYEDVVVTTAPMVDEAAAKKFIQTMNPGSAARKSAKVVQVESLKEAVGDWKKVWDNPKMVKFQNNKNKDITLEVAAEGDKWYVYRITPGKIQDFPNQGNGLDKNTALKRATDYMNKHSESFKEQTLQVKRVVYGKDSTPEKDREYGIGGHSPVGTVQEWKDFAKQKGIKQFEIIEKDGKKKIIKVESLKESLTDWEVVDHFAKGIRWQHKKTKASVSYAFKKGFNGEKDSWVVLTPKKVIPFSTKDQAIAFAKKYMSTNSESLSEANKGEIVYLKKTGEKFRVVDKQGSKYVIEDMNGMRFDGVDESEFKNKKESIRRRIEHLREALLEPVFTIKDVDQWMSKIKSGIRAPFVAIGKSTLGGEDRVSMHIAISLDKKNDWQGGYIENSNYAKFAVWNEGAVEQHSGNMKPSMRKFRFKDVNQLISKLNQYLGSVKKTECSSTKQRLERLKSRFKETTATADALVGKIKQFINSMASRLGIEKNFVVQKKSNDKIEVRTDGDVYDMLYNPSGSDFPRMADKEKEKFKKFLGQNGWAMEPYGQGIIDIYKDE